MTRQQYTVYSQPYSTTGGLKSRDQEGKLESAPHETNTTQEPGREMCLLIRGSRTSQTSQLSEVRSSRRMAYSDSTASVWVCACVWVFACVSPVSLLIRQRCGLLWRPRKKTGLAVAGATKVLQVLQVVTRCVMVKLETRTMKTETCARVRVNAPLRPCPSQPPQSVTPPPSHSHPPPLGNPHPLPRPICPPRSSCSATGGAASSFSLLCSAHTWLGISAQPPFVSSSKAAVQQQYSSSKAAAKQQ
jgi:hypothetical protein